MKAKILTKGGEREEVRAEHTFERFKCKVLTIPLNKFVFHFFASEPKWHCYAALVCGTHVN